MFSADSGTATLSEVSAGTSSPARVDNDSTISDAGRTWGAAGSCLTGWAGGFEVPEPVSLVDGVSSLESGGGQRIVGFADRPDDGDENRDRQDAEQVQLHATLGAMITHLPSRSACFSGGLSLRS